MNIVKPELNNIGHKLCVRVDGKCFEVKAIVTTDAEANTFMACNPSTALIDEDQFGNKYIAELTDISVTTKRK
jgi:hypothetical protein